MIQPRLQLGDAVPNGWLLPSRRSSYTRLNTLTERRAWFEFAVPTNPPARAEIRLRLAGMQHLLGVRLLPEQSAEAWAALKASVPDLVVATDVTSIRRGVEQGKLVSVMGVEGGHMIEGKLAVLRDFYRLGVRYMTLTHSFHLDWADSAGTGEPLPPGIGGLGPFGEEVVREMNRLGMMVDISHVSDETFRDALAVSQAPLIASHS